MTRIGYAPNDGPEDTSLRAQTSSTLIVRILRNQSVQVAGHHVITNIPWRDVGVVLMLVCKAVDVEYGSLSKLSF